MRRSLSSIFKKSSDFNAKSPQTTPRSQGVVGCASLIYRETSDFVKGCERIYPVMNSSHPGTSIHKTPLAFVKNFQSCKRGG
jgi:hypothetical protein